LITVRRSWARERIRRVDSPPLVLAHETSISERMARREQAAWTLAALEQLDSPDRRALLGWALGDDWRRLMEAEGVARSTLRTRVHRALARLRDILLRRAQAVRSDPEPSAT
jgi:DNA-directed RNA polymerase specialized sigma24 family protein